MTNEAFRHLVAKMREYQKAFFAAPIGSPERKEALLKATRATDGPVGLASKREEAKVDAELIGAPDPQECLF